MCMSHFLTSDNVQRCEMTVGSVGEALSPHLPYGKHAISTGLQ